MGMDHAHDLLTPVRAWLHLPEWGAQRGRGDTMTADIGTDTIAVLVGLLTLTVALWAQIWRTGRGIRSDLNERMYGLESKVDEATSSDIGRRMKLRATTGGSEARIVQASGGRDGNKARRVSG